METSPDALLGHTPPAEQDGRHECNWDKAHFPKSQLSYRQIRALPILAAAPNLTHAARAAGIGYSTLYRWLKNENFRLELDRLTSKFADLTWQEMQSLTLRSSKVLTDLMEDPDPAVRLRAARTVALKGLRQTNPETVKEER